MPCRALPCLASRAKRGTQNTRARARTQITKLRSTYCTPFSPPPLATAWAGTRHPPMWPNVTHTDALHPLIDTNRTFTHTRVEGQMLFRAPALFYTNSALSTSPAHRGGKKKTNQQAAAAALHCPTPSCDCDVQYKHRAFAFADPSPSARLCLLDTTDYITLRSYSRQECH